MAERRCISKAICKSDAFIEMPLSTQALYFHLVIEADDDGVISSPKRIAREINASEDDLKILIAKRFIIPFESGVVIIKHWLMMNNIRKDRYKPTTYTEEIASLTVKPNGAYTDCIKNNTWLPSGCQVVAVNQNKINQNKINKNNLLIENDSIENYLSQEEINLLSMKYPQYESILYFIDSRIKEIPAHPARYFEKIASNWGKG